MDKSDEQLILEHQQGVPEAIEMIFLRYQKPILNFAMRFLGNRADAEDVAADVFMTLLDNKDSYVHQPQAKFSTWLYTVARNACLSRIRKRKRTEDLAENEIPHNENPAVLLRKKETALVIQQAIQRLPESQREAFVLREFHGLSYEDIVEVTGNSLANVKVLIFRAREELRRNLGHLLGEARS